MPLDHETKVAVEQFTGEYLDVYDSAYAAAMQDVEDKFHESTGSPPINALDRKAYRLEERAEDIAHNVALIWFLRRGA